MNVKRQLKIESNNLPDMRENLKSELKIRKDEKRKIKWQFILSPIATLIVIAIILVAVIVPLNSNDNSSPNIINQPSLIEKTYGQAVLIALEPALFANEAGIAESSEEMEYINQVDKYLLMLKQYLYENVKVEETKKIDAYNTALKISLNNKNYLMYYNETLLSGEAATEDDDEKETVIEGILIKDNKEYKISGIKEVESEAGEFEIELEMKVFLTENQYIQVRESIEEEVFEKEKIIEYKKYENDILLENTVISIEKELNKNEVEISLTKFENGEEKKYGYSLSLEGDNAQFEVLLNGKIIFVYEVKFNENGNQYIRK